MNISPVGYRPPQQSHWTGRKDLSENGDPLYYHEKVEVLPLDRIADYTKQGTAFGLIGYASDEGARRNQGRVGAAHGPEQIRKSLSKLAWHGPNTAHLFDIGDVVCHDGDMEQAQTSLSKIVTTCLHSGIFPIVLGGSHDLAYGHGMGIFNYLSENEGNDRIGIINFDAHFDLRKKESHGNSGTPFYELADFSKNKNMDFNYLCLGIQSASNNRNLFTTAQKLGVKYFLAEQCNDLNITKELTTFISAVNHIYISIDLDAFPASVAPGVSAPSPMGLNPHLVSACLDIIVKSGKLISMDVVELNPSHDRDEQTAKLAALLVDRIIKQFLFLA